MTYRPYQRRPMRVPWSRNSDTGEQELRRQAAGGDANAAHALALMLLRSQRLTVNELAAIGTPAADALPEDLRAQLVRVLAPRIWNVVHSWDDPGRGPGSTSQTFLSEANALREAARRAMNVVYPATEWVERGGYGEGDVLLDSYADAEALIDTDPRRAWDSARTALDALQGLDADEEENRIEITWQEGPSL